MRRSFRAFLCLCLLQAAGAFVCPARGLAQEPPLNLRPDFGAREMPPVSATRAAAGSARQAAPGQRATPPQPKPRSNTYFDWELDFHTGMSWSNAPAGTTTLPSPGSTFPMFNGLPTRSVRSWFFGDGSVLLNAHMSSIGQSARITPLDAALTTSSVKPGTASPFGVRVSKALNPRLRLEFAFDAHGSMGLTEDALDAAQATRATFQSAFDARLSLGLFNRVVTSDLATTNGGSQLLLTGAVTFDLGQVGRMRPYLVAGGGPLMATGGDAEMTLTGDYRFTSGSGTPYRQTDTLTVRFRTDTVFAALIGTGFKWPLNERSGISVDLRALFAPNPVTVLLNWNPATLPGTPTNTIALSGTPGIQISTNGQFQSTLGYQRAEEDIEVATGDGTRRQASLSFGYYRRFGAPKAAPAAASGQRAVADKRYVSNRRWEADFSVGGVFGGHPTGGSRLASFPVGASFTFPGAAASRYASSWMFGDGAVLINQIASGFGAGGVADRLTPLDSVLTASSLKRSAGVGFGVRVSRRLTPRLRAAFVVESASEALEFSSSAQTAIEATRASFERIWSGIIATGSGIFTNSSVRGTATTAEADGRIMYVTGGIEYQLTRDKRMVPFVSAAAGVARRTGPLPELTLTGTYQFLFVNGGPLSEQDRVRVHFSADSSSPAGVFGAGFRYFMSARQGIRADFRIHVSGDSVTTLVDATPQSVPGTPGFSIVSSTNPALVFSNTPAVRGNFTGPAIVGLETFTGSGTAVRLNLGVGYFLRF
jgi:hypothetical protein